MTKERVNELLKQYRFELGRCGHIKAQIRELEWQYNRLERELTDAMVAPRPQQITDMPRGTQVGNPTERYAMRLVEGLRDPELQEITVKIAALEAEHDQRNITVMFVQSWLDGLSERERWVVQNQVIDGVFWRDVCSRYRQTFEEPCSKDTLKRYRDRAMLKIYAIAEQDDEKQ